MIAVTLGCDVFEGTKGMNIATVVKTIENLMLEHADDEIQVAAWIPGVSYANCEAQDLRCRLPT
jgi:hypothetical protein